MTKEKVTLEKFREYYKEFISNYINNYRLLDLDFKRVCFMKYGIKSDEFDKLMSEHERA